MFRPRQPTMENYMNGLCATAGAVLMFWMFGDSFYSIFFQGFGDHTFIGLNLP
jgi:hypothetical protein